MQEGSPAEKLSTCQGAPHWFPPLPRVIAPLAPPPPPTRTSLSPLHFSPIFMIFPIFPETRGLGANLLLFPGWTSLPLLFLPFPSPSLFVQENAISQKVPYSQPVIFKHFPSSDISAS